MVVEKFHASGETEAEAVLSLARRLAASLSYYDAQFDRYLRDPAWLQYSLATEEIKKARAALVAARALGIYPTSDES